VQFGGAVGTLASLGAEKGRAVTVGLAAELDLAAPDAPWHVSRDGLVEIACMLGLICGSLAKIATDVILLMQTEIAELFEPHETGRGGSSTMPQKRNPIASEYVLATTRGVHGLLDPAGYVGEAMAVVDRVVERAMRIIEGQPT
jgi:3-carboxy-cis,cis-muconate cycloisomerase